MLTDWIGQRGLLALDYLLGVLVTDGFLVSLILPLPGVRYLLMPWAG
ncbi:MAG: hypothetical protein M1136_09085 [Chloroflexi bacterium]|nr:hypothetical protein [Chloroflexota bacterium]